MVPEKDMIPVQYNMTLYYIRNARIVLYVKCEFWNIWLSIQIIDKDKSLSVCLSKLHLQSCHNLSMPTTIADGWTMFACMTGQGISLLGLRGRERSIIYNHCNIKAHHYLTFQCFLYQMKKNTPKHAFYQCWDLNGFFQTMK